ncbi:hypothetical protein ScPMuIL_006397 [Solemya velum]
MTLADISENMQNCEKLSMNVGDALRAAVLQAIEEGRITCGIFSCAKLLETSPEKVMFCILPEVTSDDVTVRIQHTLTEAYCAENDIRIIKVSSPAGLQKFVLDSTTGDNNPLGRVNCKDCSCVIIEFPKTEPSEQDKCLAQYGFPVYGYHQPIIDLPI